MKSGKSPITLTDIRNVLKRFQFNPKDYGTMSVIVDANNCKYWEQRAIEQLKEIHFFPLADHEVEERLVLASQLIALSLAKRAKDGQNKEA